MGYKVYNFLIKLIHSVINFVFIIILLILLIYGLYSLWDTNKIYESASPAYYSQYKPTKDEKESFEELQEKNNEIFGWITIFGTNIDYPVVQAKDNEKYIRTDVFGNYSLAGSIFLDCRNSRDLSDFSSILYGHNMSRSAMFGDINLYSDKDFFDTHLLGNLYANGKNYKIELFSFVEIDAYDDELYITNIKIDLNTYMQYVIRASKYYKDIGLTENDKIILLSTCTNTITNGRHLLIGRLTEMDQ